MTAETAMVLAITLLALIGLGLMDEHDRITLNHIERTAP